MAYQQIKHGFRRITVSALIGMAVLSGVAFAPQSASASTSDVVVGGCYFNCIGDNRVSTPATFTGVSTRADLGVIGVSINRGFRGNVRLEALVQQYTTAGWRNVDYRSQWFLDNYAVAEVICAGCGTLEMKPGTTGYHRVFVRVSYADGFTPVSGWSTSYWNLRWRQYSGWQWVSNSYAIL